VIDDLDASLRELLVRKCPIDLTAIDIKFEMPTGAWSGAVTKPTVNVFLYDVRENLELRSNERCLTRRGTTAIEERGPVRVDFSYMVTVWTTDVSDEHQLLGRVLATLVAYPVLPPEVLKGAMAEQPLPVQAAVAQPARTPNAWDFWGSLDNHVKAGVACVLTASLESAPPVEVSLVTEGVVTIEEIG